MLCNCYAKRLSSGPLSLRGPGVAGGELLGSTRFGTKKRAMGDWATMAQLMKKIRKEKTNPFLAMTMMMYVYLCVYVKQIWNSGQWRYHVRLPCFLAIVSQIKGRVADSLELGEDTRNKFEQIMGRSWWLTWMNCFRSHRCIIRSSARLMSCLKVVGIHVQIVHSTHASFYKKCLNRFGTQQSTVQSS